MLFLSFAPTRPGDSDDSHYRRLGYRVDDDSAGGKVEEQPKFVKRMGGLARLYAAAAACALPSRQADAGADHPHGLGHLWSWLASALNLRPVNDVSATLLHDVLEVAGGALGKAYGSAFLKVKKSSKLHFAISDFYIDFDWKVSNLELGNECKWMFQKLALSKLQCIRWDRMQ